MKVIANWKLWENHKMKKKKNSEDHLKEPPFHTKK